MSLVTKKCSNCGANIDIDINSKTGICQHCGTKFITQDLINNFNISNNFQNITKNIYGNGINDVDDYVKKGDVFISLGEWDKAQKAYEKAIEDNPSDWRTWFGVVKCKTENFNNFKDKSHLEYLEKARKVADEKGKDELEKLYLPFQNEIQKIDFKKKELFELELKTEKTNHEKKSAIIGFLLLFSFIALVLFLLLTK